MKKFIFALTLLSGCFSMANAVELLMKFPEPTLIPSPIDQPLPPTPWGYQNLTPDGKFYLQIDYIFEDAEKFQSHVELARVKQGGLYGFIDVTGAFVIPAVWDFAEKFDLDGFCYVSRDNKWGVIDRNGNAVIPVIYDDISYLSEDWYAVKKDGKESYVSRSGLKANTYAEYLRTAYGE